MAIKFFGGAFRMLAAFSAACACSALAHGAHGATAAMKRLPPGSIRPEGWLRDQLELQRDGLTGHGEELYFDIGGSDWLTGSKRGGQFGWERGPYYAKGLTALAFALDDENLKAKAKRWIDAYLASQRESGAFGPRDRNWWANMIALWTLRDWCEATHDERVVPFMEKYFAFQRKLFAEGDSLAKDSQWAVARAGDELDVILWLWRRTGKDEWLDFAKTLAAMSADWTEYYHRGGSGAGGPLGYRMHIVNYMQGLKTPPLKWLIGGSEEDRTAFRAALSPEGWAMKKCGRPDRMVNGTEPLSGRSSTDGTELCAIAERILSAQVALETLGDADIADDMEIVAYNTLPATLAPDIKGVRYYCLLNQPECLDNPTLFAHSGRNVCALVPGPYSGYGCCRSNFHFAWPKFTEAMWMKRENGLAATAYGDCTVKTPLATIAETGGYPFADRVRLEFKEASGGEWPLFVRIPGWCKDAKVTVNSVAEEGATPASFMRIMRRWKKGDVVEIALPCVPQATRWRDESLAVMRGPLLYSLKIDADEKVRSVSDWPNLRNDSAGVLRDGELGFPMKELRPRTPWNYALVAEESSGEMQLQVAGEGLDRHISVKAVRTGYAGWGTMRTDAPGRAKDPPKSPLPASEAQGGVERIKLVPIAFTQLRITFFPWMVSSASGSLMEKTRSYIEEFNAIDRELDKHEISADIKNAQSVDFLLKNAPRFECPDPAIEKAFAFRFWTLRKHFFRTHLGWCVSEFMDRTAISCPVGHHFREGRWLHDRSIFDDYARYWFRPGNGCYKPLNGPGSYINWFVQGLLAYEDVTGNKDLANSLLPELVKNYEKWEKGWGARPWPNPGIYQMGLRDDGLFHDVDDREGTELTLSGNGARVHVNAMMYGEAKGIAAIAARQGMWDIASAFEARAENLAKLVKERLWNKDLGFFTPLRDDGTLAPVCELHGYSPWYSRMPLDEGHAVAWRYLVDAKNGFKAPYGLTFPVQSAPGFRVAYTGHMCQWNGPSWPFATSVALTALANAIEDGAKLPIGKKEWFEAFRQYARQHYQKLPDGREIPWVDEVYDPFSGDWYAYKRMKRTTIRGYNHSTFCDLVISCLVGLKADAAGNAVVNPMIPDDWTYFRLENVPFRGSVLSVTYDRDGTRYGLGKGLKISQKFMTKQ